MHTTDSYSAFGTGGHVPLPPGKNPKPPTVTEDSVGGAVESGRRRRVPARDVLTVSTQLAIMTQSGVDLATALRSVARQCRRPAMRQVLSEVHDNVNSGATFSESLAQHPSVFNHTFRASVAAGEASGRLPEVLTQLSRLQRGELRMRASLRTLLTYPVLLVLIASSVLVALMLFVLPQFAEIFEEFDLSLPVTTALLIAVSDQLRDQAWLWTGLAVGALAASIVATRSVSGRRFRDHLLLQMPLVREVSRPLLAGRMCRLLAVMSANGVPLMQTLRLLRKSLSNELYQQLLIRMEDDLVNGRGIGTALLESPFVPPSASEMLATAERTGTVATVSQLLGEHFEEEAETKLRDLVAILEPAITVVMGVVVAFVVLSVMLPMFDLATLSQKGP